MCLVIIIRANRINPKREKERCHPEILRIRSAKILSDQSLQKRQKVQVYIRDCWTLRISPWTNVLPSISFIAATADSCSSKFIKAKCSRIIILSILPNFEKTYLRSYSPLSLFRVAMWIYVKVSGLASLLSNI